ncbi:hypothetical protein Nmel_012933 [Mimus melanotis]
MQWRKQLHLSCGKPPALVGAQGAPEPRHLHRLPEDWLKGRS